MTLAKGGADMTQFTHRRCGFTLIELLVVIAIMGALMAIMFPSLKKARQSAKDTQCLNRIRSIYVAYSNYVQDFERFPALNNDEDDGAWQYNYNIFDGRDHDENFGPLINGRSLDDAKVFFCPVQKDPYHMFNDRMNPWPAIMPRDSRAGYGRRYGMSGKSFSQFKTTIGFVADLIHLPSVIKSAHKTGVNAVYTDGHGRWVKDPGIFMDNELAHPFDLLGNSIIEDIWDAIDHAK